MPPRANQALKATNIMHSKKRHEQMLFLSHQELLWLRILYQHKAEIALASSYRRPVPNYKRPMHKAILRWILLYFELSFCVST
eukprot:scaffold164276_cov19-Prasinocladus_malaysianus.AAC.1